MEAQANSSAPTKINADSDLQPVCCPATGTVFGGTGPLPSQVSEAPAWEKVPSCLQPLGVYTLVGNSSMLCAPSGQGHVSPTFKHAEMVRKHLLPRIQPLLTDPEGLSHQSHPDLLSQLPSSPRRADKAPAAAPAPSSPLQAQADLEFLRGRFDFFPPELFSVPHTPEPSFPLDTWVSSAPESHGQNTLTKLNVEATKSQMVYTGQEGDKLEPYLRLPCWPLPSLPGPAGPNHCETACIQLGGSEVPTLQECRTQSHSNPLAELGLLESPNPSRCQGCLSQQWDSWTHRGSEQRRWARAASHADQDETAKSQRARETLFLLRKVGLL